MVGLTGSSQSEYVKTFVTVAKEEVRSPIFHVSEWGYPFKFRLGPAAVCSTTEVEAELALQVQRLIVLVTQVILERWFKAAHQHHHDHDHDHQCSQQVIEYLSSSRSGAPVLAVKFLSITILMLRFFWAGWNILGWDHPRSLSCERGWRCQSWGSPSCVRQSHLFILTLMKVSLSVNHLSQILLPVCFDTFEGCNSLEGDWLNRQLNRYHPIWLQVKAEEQTLFPPQPLDKVAGGLDWKSKAAIWKK